MIIGLVGGVASGKSFVGRKLAELVNGVVIDADQIARSVVDQPNTQQALRQAFGSEIFDASGKLDRTALASLVFGLSEESKNRRLQLNAIVHPEVRRRAWELIHETRTADAKRWIIIDAPLLLEAGWAPHCDRILFIETSEAFRKQNALKRGWTADEVFHRERSQLPLIQKREASTDVILNSGDEVELVTTLREWVTQVRAAATEK